MITFTYSPTDIKVCIESSNDLGCTIWDTVDIYGNGTNEIFLSRVRNEVFLSFSKSGIANSEFKATLRCAYKVHPIAEIQIEYSSWTLDIETNGIMEAYHELGNNFVVIPDARKIKRLEENVEAVTVNFGSEELFEIRQIINSIEIV
ncbi:unnamed protein product [Rhizophagus irregularis]|nr:unnamed protein product [Rhizophagus irregularis]CAB4490867.1 unnamed protein product [Rhizophagus irregularis]